MRFMLTHNKKHPRVYKITKVLDLAPQGILRLTVKQDEYNEKRDDLGLMVCDYYDDSGNSRPVEPEEPSDKSQAIYQYTLNDDYELVDPTEVSDTTIYFGIVKYFGIVDDSAAVYHWTIKLDSSSSDALHEDSYYEQLIQIQEVDSRTISLQVSKAKSVIGKKFTLSVYDKDNTSYSSLSLTVQED